MKASKTFEGRTGAGNAIKLRAKKEDRFAAIHFEGEIEVQAGEVLAFQEAFFSMVKYQGETIEVVKMGVWRHKEVVTSITPEMSEYIDEAKKEFAEAFDPFPHLQLELKQRGKTYGGEGDGDPWELWEVTDKRTGESGKFRCRNIFDFGFVINPEYALAEGLEPGGMRRGDVWTAWKNGESVEVRPVTQFEGEAMDALREKSGISCGIRM